MKVETYKTSVVNYYNIEIETSLGVITWSYNDDPYDELLQQESGYDIYAELPDEEQEQIYDLLDEITVQLLNNGEYDETILDYK